MELAVPYLLQIAQLIGYVVVVTFFILKMNMNIRLIEKSIEVKMDGVDGQLVILKDSFVKLGDILTQIAVQSAEIASLKEDLKDLRHGRGWVVDGEYTRQGKVR